MPNNTTNSTVASKAPLYNETAPSPDAGGFLPDIAEPTLPQVLDLAVRVGPYWIGSGSGPGGEPAGVLLLGLVVGGAVVSVGSSARFGPVAGGVIAITTVGLVAEVGLAPAWLFAVALFLLGLVLTTVFLRSL
jgi:hypothetical protein